MVAYGDVVAVSTLLGGAAAVVPNGFLAARLLTPSRDVSAGAMMRAAWLGEIGKVLLTALVFGVIFGFVTADLAAGGVRGLHRRATGGVRRSAGRAAGLATKQ